MKEYHEMFLKCDALLLVDVFETFKNSSLKSYELCLSHYLSAAALSWNAILSMTKAELELIADADMYLFFEKSMRGGVYYIFKK